MTDKLGQYRGLNAFFSRRMERRVGKVRKRSEMGVNYSISIKIESGVRGPDDDHSSSSVTLALLMSL